MTTVPAAGEVVKASPGEIRLVFSEPIEPGYPKVDLFGPDGATRLVLRDPRLASRKLVAGTLTLAAIVAGGLLTKVDVGALDKLDACRAKRHRLARHVLEPKRFVTEDLQHGGDGILEPARVRGASPS